MNDSDRKNEAKKREAETQWVETQRAFSVAIAKTAHGLIEMVERGRKKGLILSLIERIDSFFRIYNAYSDMLKSYVDALTRFQLTQSNQRDFTQSLTDLVHTFTDTYKSIRKDVENNLEIKDFEELFPERSTCFETLSQGIPIITGLAEQLAQFRAYLQRYLV